MARLSKLAYQITLTAILSVSSVIGLAEGVFDSTRLEPYLKKMEAEGSDMFSLAIVKNSKVVYQTSIGYSNFEEGTHANAETKYLIGSISKTFTAVMVMQLIEEGDLSLTTRLSEYYPDVNNAERITIDQLLRHRTGLYNYTDAHQNGLDFYSSSLQKEDLLNAINSHDLAFAPGKGFQYSNSNFLLLGYIIEDISGESYSDQLKSRITDVIGLDNTYFGNRKVDPSRNEALSYTYEDGQWEVSPGIHTRLTHGAGGISSTPSDVALFMSALFNGKLVSLASLESMQEMETDYGKGLAKIDTKDGAAYGHSGRIESFQSETAYYVSGP